MSLLNDPEFLIHNLRLNYLRNVDDPYGARLISLNPSFSSNPYIVAASLADPERWPELAAPSSPPLSEDETEQLRSRNVTGFPGATGLKYTQTILGPSRTGFMGMRVGDRRSTTGARRSARFSTHPRTRKDNPAADDSITATSAPLPSQGKTDRETSPPLSNSVGTTAVSVDTQSQDEEFSSGDESSVADDEEDFDDGVELDDGLDLDEDDFDSQSRLSAVHEDQTTEGASSLDKPIEGYFEMVTPAVKSNDEKPSTTSDTSVESSRSANTVELTPAESFFAREEVVARKPAKSALSSLLASSNSSNPFSDLYSAISGRGVPAAASTTITVFFPRARAPAGKPMLLNVRKDATMEEVLGFALWNYWEEGWEPRLDEEPEKTEDLLSAVGWVMRIAEDDGEVDEDFPPPDRTGRIAKFGFDFYAVLEATATQVQQNKILEAKIQRDPSRVTTKVKKLDAPTLGGLAATAPGPGTSAIFGSNLGTSIFSTSFGPSPSYGPQMFLRIRVLDTADAVHISTTIPVSSTMYMQESLELVCRKRKLQNPKEYALLLGDMSILIPLDRTVASLQGKSDLMLVKRSMLPHLGVDLGKTTGKTTDPNASIFTRMSEVPESQPAADYTAAYKKYVVFRKMPMLVGRHERVLAIDGAYIHIMPSSNKAKAVFDSGKTSSYHINSIVACQQSAKSSSSFRFTVHRDGGNKRYEFEADNAKTANEIVQIIRGMKIALDRSSTIVKSRRSRQVS